MIVCVCKRVSNREIHRRLEKGCRNVRDLGRSCRAGTDCGACTSQLVEMVRAHREKRERAG